MHLISIHLARALAFLEVEALNLHGKVSMPNLIQELANLCQFMKKPSAPEQFDLKEGIEFENGFYEGVTVKKLVLYQQVIYVDTNTSTDESKRILLSLLAWAKETHGIAFDPALISKWA